MPAINPSSVKGLSSIKAAHFNAGRRRSGGSLGHIEVLAKIGDLFDAPPALLAGEIRIRLLRLFGLLGRRPGL